MAFKYQRRSAEQVQDRVNKRGGSFDSIFFDQFKVLSTKSGSYDLRLLPPTWENPQHYGFDIQVHYGVGGNNQSYLCLGSIGQHCPVCAERAKAAKEGDKEYAKQLAPRPRVAAWVIDRHAEKEGPQLWAMPFRFDKDLAGLCLNKRTGEAVCIDDPDEGFDISFDREGEGTKTRYAQLQVAREATPVCDDFDIGKKWLDYVVAHPVPTTLHYYDAEHIEAVFSGNVSDDTDYSEQGHTESGETPEIDEKSYGQQPQDAPLPDPPAEIQQKEVKPTTQTASKQPDDSKIGKPSETANKPADSSKRRRLFRDL